MQEEVKFFVIQATGTEEVPDSFMYLKAHGEVFVSPTGRLCGMGKLAQIDSQALAERFSEALTVKFQKRYGSGFQLRVMRVSQMTPKAGKEREKIKRHSEQVTDWLSKGK